MDETGMSDLQYKAMVRKQIREYERIIKLGVSDAAKEEIEAEIEDLKAVLED